jgi:hypothetical protein
MLQTVEFLFFRVLGFLLFVFFSKKRRRAGESNFFGFYFPKIFFLLIKTACQSCTQRSSARPYGVGLIVAGYDVSQKFFKKEEEKKFLTKK